MISPFRRSAKARDARVLPTAVGPANTKTLGLEPSLVGGTATGDVLIDVAVVLRADWMRGMRMQSKMGRCH